MAERTAPKYRILALSCLISFAMLVILLVMEGAPEIHNIVSRLLYPLIRIMIFITVGLVLGQFIEAAGWTRYLARLAGPLFRFGRLGEHCSAAFTTAFLSGVSANAMLLEFYKSGKIKKKQLFLSNFINQMPAFFLHLPTTFFIVIPLTGWAGALYFLLTFAAMIFRTAVFLIYGHYQGDNDLDLNASDDTINRTQTEKRNGFWDVMGSRLAGRIAGIATYILPIYVLVYMLNSAGLFEYLREWLARFVVAGFIPVESFSLVIISFAAEFTSGFAAAGALMDAGAINIKQAVMALLIGNIIAFPVRTLRHQLPRYIGIFSPGMGTQLLLMGQTFRILSIILAGVVFYLIA